MNDTAKLQKLIAIEKKRLQKEKEQEEALEKRKKLIAEWIFLKLED